MSRTPDIIRRYIEEDLGHGDITTESMGDLGMASASIVAKEPCTLAGIAEARAVFDYFDVSSEATAADGASVAAGTTVLHMSGPAAGILTGERTALNLLMHMSGIATLTRKLVDKARAANPGVRIAATRKTAPGFRILAKRAVVLGGGDPHRIRLDDMVLIKDNHIRAVGGVGEAVRRAKASHFSKKVEAEAETEAQAVEAALAGADIVMLDNMGVDEARHAAEAARRARPGVVIEISGGINEDNIAGYAAFADVVSVGAITHSYRSIDFSLEMEDARAKSV